MSSSHVRWGNIPDSVYSSVKALLEALKLVEPSTYEHCTRVGEYSRKLARDLGLNEYEQKKAEFAGMLHDIGKIGIDKAILLKPGRLESNEIAIIKDHSLMSEAIVKPLAGLVFFEQILPAIRGHHERLDGLGYPDKKVGDEIHLISRIISVVDTFDAMSEDRIYRKGLPEDVVMKEIERCSGSQFDPHIAKIFLQAYPFWKEDTEMETYNLITRKIA
jgi:putative nucleotidyltransferase with HDIG domain